MVVYISAETTPTNHLISINVGAAQSSRNKIGDNEVVEAVSQIFVRWLLSEKQ